MASDQFNIDDIELPKSDPRLDKIVDEVISETSKAEDIEKDLEEQIKILLTIIDDCKNSKPYETPNLDIKVMTLEVLKTLNDQNRERFDYHERTSNTLVRIEEYQKKIDKKYTNKAIGFIVVATLVSTIVIWENKEVIFSLLEPIWKIAEPFLKITKGE